MAELGIDSLLIQPFIELDLTIKKEKYNRDKDDSKKLKTTLRTLIVPRNFSSPLEVTQPGVQGSGN